MNRKEFTEEIVEKRIEKIREVLASKADEYAVNDHAFYNFIRAAEVNLQEPKEALWGMATKHLVSVIDIVESDEQFSNEYIDEKIGDMINYLILLEGLLKDEYLELYNK